MQKQGKKLVDRKGNMRERRTKGQKLQEGQKKGKKCGRSKTTNTYEKGKRPKREKKSKGKTLGVLGSSVQKKVTGQMVWGLWCFTGGGKRKKYEGGTVKKTGADVGWDKPWGGNKQVARL